MKNPASERQTPLERQLTVVVAWLAHHSELFARAILLRFFDGDAKALATMSGDGLRIGARTWGTLRPVPGLTGPLFPDITITGSARAFELIVEMKIDAGVHTSGQLSGRMLYQPDAYAHSWIKNYDPSREAGVRRVGTLTREGVDVELLPEFAAWRAAPVRWREVREDLNGLLERGEVEVEVRTVAQEVLEAIDDFVLATAVPGIEAKLEHLPPELTWGYRLLALLGPSLAEVLPGGALKQGLSLGAKHVYIGCNVYFTTAEGERCLWLQVSPAGGGYAIPDTPVSLWAAEQADHGRWPGAIRQQAVGAGFREETDNAGYRALRRAFPMETLISLGDETAQAGWVLGQLVATLAE
jgi:hypothetical protein